jgi:hypothetical protein
MKQREHPMKKIAVILSCAIAGVVVGSAVPAAQIVIANSTECIDIPHQDTNDGTPLSLFNCHGSPNEQWTIANGTITGMSGVCLDIMGSAPNDGAQAIIVHCNGRPSEKWSIVNGQIVGLGGKCLDVAGGTVQDHAQLIIKTCSPSPSQQWSVQ